MRISTIIPAYNRADLIGETLRTVLSQSRPPHEVIVVDDGSTDGTPDAVSAFGKDVVLIRQANAGAGAARNAGFARSSGEIVHFMDSDDLCSLNFYDAGAKCIEAGADMTYGPWLKTRFDGMLLEPEPVVIQSGPVPSDVALDVLVLLVDWVTVFQPCLFRRDLILRAGPYRQDLKPSEDSELLYRILAMAKAPTHVGEGLILYRVHPENQVSEQNLAKRMIDWADFWAVMQQHADARDDLSPAVRRVIRRKKLQVAHEVRPYDPQRAQALAAAASVPDRMLRPWRKLAHRFHIRSKARLTGNPYTAPYQAGPVTAGQRELIRQLGYSLPAGKGRK